MLTDSFNKIELIIGVKCEFHEVVNSSVLKGQWVIIQHYLGEN